MKFVLAPDKFKGSLTGFEFCEAVEIGIRKVFPHATIIKKPLADGGDGTLEVVKKYLRASEVQTTVHDPFFRKIQAHYLFSKKRKTAFIEMSEASGIRLIKREELDCMKTTTLGTGELIVDALKRGAKQIFLGIGGSATNDGGMGVAAALGYSFLDKEGKTLLPIGENLIKVHTISAPKESLTKGVDFKIACDVNNPFYGPQGAAHVYAAQKGATGEQIDILDDGLKSFAGRIAEAMSVNLQEIDGAGAAGGLGGGSVAFLEGTLVSGISLIKEIADFETSLVNVNWIITGEGKLDNQTLSGKTVSGVLESAKKYKIGVAAFCGVVDLSPREQEELGLTYVTSILKDLQSLEEAMESSFDNLVFATYNFAKILKKDITLY